MIIYGVDLTYGHMDIGIPRDWHGNHEPIPFGVPNMVQVLQLHAARMKSISLKSEATTDGLSFVGRKNNDDWFDRYG